MHDKTSYFIPSGYDRFSILKSSDTQHDIDVDYFEMIKDEEKMLNMDQIMEEEIVMNAEKQILKVFKERYSEIIIPILLVFQ